MSKITIASSRNRSLRVIDRAALADKIYFDLTGVLDLFLDLLRHVTCDDLHARVIDLFGLYHHADLTARLNSICFVNTGEADCDLLKLFKSLDVVFKILASCTGSCSRNGIRRLDQHGNDRLRFDVVVVSLDSVDDLAALLEFLCGIYADLDVCALNIVRERFPDIVEKSRAACRCGILTELLSHNTRKKRDFHRMAQHVLTVACAVSQSAEQLYKLGIEPVNTDLECCAFARLLYARLDLALCLFHHLLDACGVDAPVGDQLFKSDARDLAPYRIKARKGYRLRCVVDDKLNAREGLELLNVSALASDYPALHVLARPRSAVSQEI